MKELIDKRIIVIENKWVAECINCQKRVAFLYKTNAVRMLNRGTCRNCKKDYRNVKTSIPIYKNSESKWCKICSGCGIEQAYTRKDHAKQSYLGDKQCRDCVSKSKAFSNNKPVGDKTRLFNKFLKSSKLRGIEWKLTLEEMFDNYTGKCALTGWNIDINFSNCTASLDRIDNSKGYTFDNIQWVHSMVNMCKNKYSQKDFIKMCKNIAENINYAC